MNTFFVHCSRFIVEKCTIPKILLKALVVVSAVDLHVAFSLLRMCGSHCKLVHLARVTPPSLCAEYLKLFDEEVTMQSRADKAIPKPKMQAEIYGRLNMSLVRSVARSIMGMGVIQGSLALCLRTSALPPADPLVAPTSSSIFELSGKTAVESKAAGLPIVQLGTKMSAGWLCGLSAPDP
ncbi:hypothetical protein EMCRGX_G008049 [Ephydatia muelleri]